MAVNENEAPEGYIAVLQDVMLHCEHCAFDHLQSYVEIEVGCSASQHDDWCYVIFKSKEGVY